MGAGGKWEGHSAREERGNGNVQGCREEMGNGGMHGSRQRRGSGGMQGCRELKRKGLPEASTAASDGEHGRREGMRGWGRRWESKKDVQEGEVATVRPAANAQRRMPERG